MLLFLQVSKSYNCRMPWGNWKSSLCEHFCPPHHKKPTNMYFAHIIVKCWLELRGRTEGQDPSWFQFRKWIGDFLQISHHLSSVAFERTIRILPALDRLWKKIYLPNENWILPHATTVISNCDLWTEGSTPFLEPHHNCGVQKPDKVIHIPRKRRKMQLWKESFIVKKKEKEKSNDGKLPSLLELIYGVTIILPMMMTTLEL